MFFVTVTAVNSFNDCHYVILIKEMNDHYKLKFNTLFIDFLNRIILVV